MQELNITWISEKNTNQDTGEAIDATHSTTYRGYTEREERINLTIIEAEDENITPADLADWFAKNNPITLQGDWELG